MLDLILDCTKVFKMIGSGLVSTLIINVIVKYLSKQFSEIFGAFFKKLISTEEFVKTERREFASAA